MRIILLLLSSVAMAQTPTIQPAPVWFTVIPAAQQSSSVAVNLPAGTTYRFLSVNGKATAPITTTAAAAVSDWDDGLNGRPLDPDPGVRKAMQVSELPAAFSASVVDASVKPSKTTTVTVPALSTAPPQIPAPVPVPAPVPSPAPKVVATYACTINIYSDGTFQSSNCVVKP